MNHVCSLASEILDNILMRLDGPDLRNVAQTCRTLWNAVYIDNIWQYICKRGGCSLLECLCGIDCQVGVQDVAIREMEK